VVAAAPTPPPEGQTPQTPHENRPFFIELKFKKMACSMKRVSKGIFGQILFLANLSFYKNDHE